MVRASNGQAITIRIKSGRKRQARDQSTHYGEFHLQADVLPFHRRERSSYARGSSQRLRAFQAWHGTAQSAGNTGSSSSHEQLAHVFPENSTRRVRFGRLSSEKPERGRQQASASLILAALPRTLLKDRDGTLGNGILAGGLQPTGRGVKHRIRSQQMLQNELIVTRRFSQEHLMICKRERERECLWFLS